MTPTSYPSFRFPTLQEWFNESADDPIEESSSLSGIIKEGAEIGARGLFYGVSSHALSTTNFSTAGIYGLAYGLSSSITSRVKSYLVDGRQLSTLQKVLSYFLEIGVNIIASAKISSILGYSIAFTEAVKIFALCSIIQIAAVAMITLLFGSTISNLSEARSAF